MIENLLILIELFSILYSLAKFFGRKFEISIHAVVLILLQLFLLTGINHYGTPAYLRSLVYVGQFLYALLYYGESIKVTLVNYFLSAILIVSLQFLLYFPIVYLVSLNDENARLIQLIIAFSCMFFIWLLDRWIILKRISKIILKKNKLLVCILILILAILGINIYQTGRVRGMMLEKYLQIIYFLAFTVFLIYEWQKSKADAEKKKMQLEMNALYYDAYDQLLMLVRERQHDMKNHISAIVSMGYTIKDYDMLVARQREYCGLVLEQNEEAKLLLSTENPLVIGFVYSKLEEAKAKEIKIEHHIKLISKELFLPEYELVDMIGILMDNAIEALADIPARERKISLSLAENEEGLTLTIANTSNFYEKDMTAHFFENGYSSKGKDRGIGLSKLKKLVDKWGGTITVSNELRGESNYLSFEIYIPKERISQNKLRNKKRIT